MILGVENNLDQLPSTLFSYTSVNLAAGGTAIPIKNTNSFTNQYAVQLGKTGEEQSEIRIINTPSGTILPLNTGTLVYDHPMDTPVFHIHYDQIIFKRSVSGTAGTAVALATVAITPDSLYTEYNDSSGAATYAYKTQYYNSVSADISSESDWFTPSGPSFYSLQKLRDRAKKALFNATFITDDTIIDDWINEWIEQMTNKALKVNQAYSLGTAAYSFGTAGLGTVTEPLFKYATKFEITTDGVSYVNSTEIPVNGFSSTDVFSPLAPNHYWQGDTVFGILPQGSLGTVRLTLGKLATQLTSDIDALPQYLRGYTTGCIEYVLYRAYDMDQKDTVADKHFKRFKDSQMEFLVEITPRDQTGPKTITLVDSLSGFQEDDLLGEW
jgi:hypothetical protein